MQKCFRRKGALGSRFRISVKQQCSKLAMIGITGFFLLDRRLIFFHLNLILTTELQFESFCSCFEGEKKIKIVFKNWIPFLSHFNLLKICKYVKSQDFDLESYGLVGFYFWDIKLFDKPRGIIFFVIFLSALTLNCVSPIHSFEQHTPHLFLLSNRKTSFPRRLKV